MGSRHMKRTILLAAAVALAASLVPAAPAYVWWEAENPVESDFPEKTWLSPANAREADVLSGGAWLTRDDHTPGRLKAMYRVNVPEEGNYELWVRKFGQHGPFRWRFDEGEWMETAQSGKGMNSLPLDIAAERYISASWFNLGEIFLKTGDTPFQIELLDSEKPTCAIDCFALIKGHFVPRGRLRPDEKYNRSPEGWFPFEPDRDGFEVSPIDMIRLNEKEAGSAGRVVRRGDGLVFEKSGEEVRFWGVTAVSSVWTMDRQDMDYLARRLAKMGVNMVRFHVAPFHEKEPGPQTEGVHYLVAALKKHGIYSGFNWYCLACNKVQASWTWDGFNTGDPLHALHLFYPPLQLLYKQWAKTLFGTENPHTGMTLAKDPSVVYIELIDEDNYLFWTFKPEQINPRALPWLEREFGDWAKHKYGSIEQALDSWGDQKKPSHGTDDPDTGRIALYPAMLLGGADWMVTQRNANRASDQLRFMVEDMRAFYSGMKQWLHDELGYDGLVVGTNWKTIDDRVAGPLDFYANMAVDVTARNTYFSGPHKRTRFHPWMVGDAYQDRTLLRDPEAAITMHMQYADHPHFITEGGWAMPNRFRTEEQLIMAAYASLQGIDGLFPFVIEPDWAMTRGTWPIQTAATIGQYPAASLIYRRGYIEKGPVVVNEALRLDDLYAFKGAAISQPPGMDSHRAAEIPDGVVAEVDSLAGVDPLAFYVGRVLRTIGEEPGKSSMLTELTRHIDYKRKIIRSATGQTTFDYGKGVVSINAPCAQGATGFLAEAGVIELSALRIDMKNEYGAIILVSLDAKPLAESASMLLQVMTEEKDFNWETKPVRIAFKKNQLEVDAKEIVNIGTAPLVVRKVEGSISLLRPDASALKVTALDHNGYARGSVEGRRKIDLLPDVLYYHIVK